MGYFNDSEFQERMLALASSDPKFLRRVGTLLNENDFAPPAGGGIEDTVRYVIAKMCLQHWREYRQPIAGLLRAEVQDYVRANRQKLGVQTRELFFTLAERLKEPDLLLAVDSVEDKIIQYKRRQRFRKFTQDIISAQSNNQLDLERFRALTRNVLNAEDDVGEVIDYGTTLEQRIRRREIQRGRKLPYTYIEPLDEAVRVAPRGQISVILAKYGTGKSVMASHLARVFALQGLNVLLFTLEDPVEQVENRLDAALMYVPLVELENEADTLRERFSLEWERMRAQIKLVNATGGGWTVERLSEFWELQRNRGFIADVVILDYDKKIAPSHRYKGDNAAQLQSTDSYMELSNWAARDQLFMWVLAQARRSGKEDKMIVIGDDAAEDINKLREAGMCIGIGYGPKELREIWPEDLRFLYIAKHRFDKSMIGFPVVGNFSMGIFCDREETAKANQLWLKIKERYRRIEPRGPKTN